MAASLRARTTSSVVLTDTVSDKTTLFGRYTIYSDNDFAGTNSQSPYAGFNTGQTIFNQNAMLSVTHVFTPNVVMSLKGIFNRLNNQQPLGPQGVVPSRDSFC